VIEKPQKPFFIFFIFHFGDISPVKKRKKNAAPNTGENLKKYLSKDTKPG
jgi:hypothetical protein